MSGFSHTIAVLCAILLFSPLPECLGGAFTLLQSGSSCKDHNKINAESFEQCRKRTETHAMSRTFSKVSRSGLKLDLALADGKTKTFTDEPQEPDDNRCGYRFVTYLREGGFYLIDQKCGPDHVYQLVSEVDGKTQASGTEYPKPSPTGDRVLMIDANRQLKIPLLQIWALKRRGQVYRDTKIELKQIAAVEWQNNLYSRWHDSYTIKIADEPDDVMDRSLLAIVRSDGKKWSIQHNDFALEKRRK